MINSLSRQFGKSIQQVEAQLKGIKAIGSWVDEAFPSAGTHDSGGSFDIRIADDPNRTPVQFKNDGYTFKKPKQDLPYWVELERRKRR